MMGHREAMKCGGEVDATSRHARRLYAGKTAGVLRYWKRQLSRRARRNGKADIVGVQRQHGTLVGVA